MKEIKVFAGVSFSFVVAFAVAASGLFSSCGGDDKPSESDYRDVCLQSCSKIKECQPLAAGIIGDCNVFCTPKPGDPNNPTGEGCTNGAEILSKARECLTKSCSEFITCGEMIPDCQGATSTPGTGGSTGSGLGGSTGTPGLGGTTGAGRGGSTGAGSGGASGNADAGAGSAGCEDCVRAQMCFEAAAADAGLPGGLGGQNFAQTCTMATGTTRDQIIAGCKAAVQSLCR